MSPEVIAQRFWPKVDRTGGDDACWEFKGARHLWGYGKFSVGYVPTDAHRVAYMLEYGPIADGVVIRHDCDNPPCCNPKHLRPGSFKDNSQDAARRGRMCRGEQQIGAKLTDDQVREARALYRPGHREFGQTALARRYGVCQMTMRAILIRKTWKHVD